MPNQACGQHLQVINCNNLLTNDIAEKYVKGLIASGSWILLNKFDQLNLGK